MITKTNKTASKKVTRRQHSLEFRNEALARVDKLGVAKAASELGLHSSFEASIGGGGRGACHRKKGSHILRKKPEVKYVFMQKYQGTVRVSTMRRVLQVDPSHEQGVHHQWA